MFKTTVQNKKDPIKKKPKEEEPKDPNYREYSLFSNMLYIIKGMFGTQKPLLFFIPLGIAAEVANTYLPSFALRAVISDISNGVQTERLLHTALLFAFMMLAAGAAQRLADANLWWRWIGARMNFIMMRIRKVLYMDYEHLESPVVMKAQGKAQYATDGNNNGVEGMMRSSYEVMKVFASSFTAVLIIGRLSFWIVFVIFVFGALYFLSMDRTKRKDKKIWDECSPYWHKQWYMLNTMTDFTYGKDIRLFSMGGWLLRKYAGLQDYLHERMCESKNRWMGHTIFSNILGLVNLAVVYGYLISRVLAGRISIADFSLYLGAIASFNNVLQQVFNNVTDLRQQSRQINDFRTFLEYPERGTFQDAQGAPPSLKGMDKYVFTFENVSFKYAEAPDYALKDLNLTLEAGEHLAVVGLNGAGKSTFIKLLCGLYVPTSGRILLNGVDIRRYDKREYYELFAPVFQNVELFAFSMGENVSMRGSGETDTDRAISCLRDAGLSEKLDTLPKGVETQLLKVLHDDGIDLSGGERQKLAFARALYKNSPIVILDEPTSALDALAEYKMYMDFDRLIGKKSAVYISHRLSSTRFCDHVALFEEGTIKEYGTHESLMEKGGAYCEMFNVQAQYYREEGGADEA